ncbi:MAG: hypothetical protein LBC71_02590 [Oscillospiraceae bacterium]|jgi:hypothetical protein|nr:hypothetical protein [Oscillospiraceae bacterium]
MKKIKKIKTPPHGGASAAAWEHHLKPHQKEELAEYHRLLQEHKQVVGKKILTALVIINLALAIFSVVFTFNFVLLVIRVAPSVILYLRFSWSKVVFLLGTLISIFIVSTIWATITEAGIVSIVAAISGIAVMLVTSLLIFANEALSDYMYK